MLLRSVQSLRCQDWLTHKIIHILIATTAAASHIIIGHIIISHIIISHIIIKHTTIRNIIRRIITLHITHIIINRITINNPIGIIITRYRRPRGRFDGTADPKYNGST